MSTLFIAAAIVLAFVVLILLAARSGRPRELPYRLGDPLLSKAERSFYGVLVQALGAEAVVFTKVRVADVLSPAKGLNRSERQQAQNRINAKHFDFVICEPTDCTVRAVVELDDASHGRAKTQERDAFLNAACAAAGLPFLRVRAAKAYVLAELRQQLDQLLNPKAEALTEEAAPADGSQ